MGSTPGVKPKPGGKSGRVTAGKVCPPAEGLCLWRLVHAGFGCGSADSARDSRHFGEPTPIAGGFSFFLCRPSSSEVEEEDGEIVSASFHCFRVIRSVCAIRGPRRRR